LTSGLTCSLGDDTSERRLRRGVKVGFAVVGENDRHVAAVQSRKNEEYCLEACPAVL
jgi:hypothetical protein